ncbi:uncharacterized protein BX664DRAFT_296172 [Halteromyces radiatus]|uniref:uncharacterized protein n=1 Tax=Halteromyces radiatus TaxID=101107 RepID=UPI002220A6C9|nr:uncharacterized protein BX664DRAFT_296172 [Halteromyces radiatus]KAI8088816.1 hypothetical protein BX664DRAFT_296172 [Halteromyces radiatus]
MLILKYNELPAHDLFIIERHLVRWLDHKGPKITPEWHVLDLSRTDLYGHLLGIFAHLKVFDTLNITPSQLLDFLIDVDTAYLHTPYHSFFHAADIVVMLYYILMELDGLKQLQPIDMPRLLIAALCHDMGHPGYNNLYQVNFKTPLAQRYNNKSVLENYSVDITQDLLNKHKLFDNVSYEWKDSIKQLILSTDMVYHYELQEKAGALEERLLSSSQCHDFCRIILHAADISNTVRPWAISKQWSDLIVQEFFRQGDAEKQAGLSVSPGMDRDESNQATISLKFGDFVVKPYFEALAGLLPKCRVFLTTLADNRMEWMQLKDNPMTMALTPPPPPHERHFPSRLLPSVPVPNPSGRRVSVPAGIVIIPDHHHWQKQRQLNKRRYHQIYHHHRRHHHRINKFIWSSSQQVRQRFTIRSASHPIVIPDLLFRHSDSTTLIGTDHLSHRFEAQRKHSDGSSEETNNNDSVNLITSLEQ